MRRRDLLLLVLSLLPARLYARRSKGIVVGVPQGVADVLLQSLGAPESAQVVGALYLQQCPLERDRSRLLAALDLGDCCDGAPAAAGIVARRQRDDFAHGRVVRLDGWILSETEARLCALAAL